MRNCELRRIRRGLTNPRKKHTSVGMEIARLRMAPRLLNEVFADKKQNKN